MDITFLRDRVDSYIIHHWMECVPSSNGAHTPSDNEWSMN